MNIRFTLINSYIQKREVFVFVYYHVFSYIILVFPRFKRNILDENFFDTNKNFFSNKYFSIFILYS